MIDPVLGYYRYRGKARTQEADGPASHLPPFHLRSQIGTSSFPGGGSA